jgi:hypothetical protein
MVRRYFTLFSAAALIFTPPHPILLIKPLPVRGDVDVDDDDDGSGDSGGGGGDGNGDCGGVGNSYGNSFATAMACRDG